MRSVPGLSEGWDIGSIEYQEVMMMSTDSSNFVGSSHLLRVDDVRSVESEAQRPGRQQLTEMEQLQLTAWNATRQDYPRNTCVPQLVAKQAAATPDAVALVAGDQALSYGELNRRANQLAHYLQTLGVGPNVLVGLCVERSLDMVVGLLGILKAGGAYLPLDPSSPAERLAFMLADAHAPVLVTQRALAAPISIQGTQVVCLDADAALLGRQSVADPSSKTASNDLAYVIYTSGSTGQPKGVQIIHDGLLNLVFWHQRAYEVTPSDRTTQLTSPAFDATGWELWPYLTIGASVYLPADDTRTSPPSLRDWLIRCGITITFLPTPLAESVMFLEWPPAAALRLLLTGADTLRHYPPATLPFAVVNNYGPTETTVVATYGQVRPTAHADGPPSIGRPIANTQIYILDEQLQPVPMGVPGELYIGGAGLARGYLNRPELTAERFIANPFNAEPESRLYKTGDLARYLPDGQIAFLGRSDHQIKIRGHRIEPDEIVSVLNSQPAIQASLVVAREDSPDDKRLVAYLVLVPGTHLTASALYEAIRRHLPDYMIPATFVLLDMLPVTPNGKVDRSDLPAPDAANVLRDAVIAAPGTPTEERLAGIVSDLLGVDQLGIDDNFFLLGGNSMMGTQLIMRVAETFGISLLLRTLFEAPTVRQLALEIERRIIARVQAMSDEEARLLLG
ncbi:MAG: amino acid adenylation domain-containing protein [Chloroflexota bacterium]|nr:amino acid adenylation domain-containing protein [Chloroflexota bacterium]